jgi:mono/diheme cytochrome c family protein
VVGVTLDPKPVDFRAEHVKDLSDGELFYIITNGIEGTAMQAWTILDEEKRWDLVNYLRTFQE